ncbi:hypothetical protein GUA87_17645 [Sneathiella sp. P13V-1]|uniref:hypothetical protein n=1 Tax=Sneathiella sp. P13V-1 TaxID=2697366 RepID=UPI00187BBFC3|nr:hypothetical protein [Sneathiella sp. P13V-1]MBE7638684.1 hypothetical protein [Sneathiella sp. P13V-1]
MKSLKFLPSLAVFLMPAVAAAGGGHNHDHDHHGHKHDHGHGHAHDNHDDGLKSGFYGDLHLQVFFDHIYSAAESDEEINEAYTHSHFQLGYGFGNGLSINSNIELEGEPAGHDHGGGGAVLDGTDRFFEDTPLFIRELTINYDHEYFGVYAGKFDPVVSFDKHAMPGIYGYQVVDEYDVREKIGFGGYGRYDAGNFGTHRLDISTFFADTTFMSNSVLYQRGDVDKEDGSVSNTENFSSFAISLGGSDFHSDSSVVPEGLSYRVGFAHQAKGEGDEKDENRYTVSGQYEHSFNDSWRGRLLGEVVHIDHLNGEAPHDRTYYTAGAELGYNQWVLGSTYTYVHNDNPDEPDEDQDGEFFQASLAYTFDIGITLGAGYRFQEEEGERNHRIGAMVGYTLAF